MSATLNLGTDGNWATKKDTILAYNDENSNFKPLPFSFSRASSATVINKDGLIETVGSGEPRIDFKDNTKGSLLLEPQRSNLITYSEQLDNGSGWINQLGNTVVGNQIGVGNSTTAWKLNKASGTFKSLRFQSTLSSANYTLSWYLKKGSLDVVEFRFDGGASAQFIDFNLSTGVAGTNNALTNIKMELINNEWYRCQASYNSALTNVHLYLGDASSTTEEGYVYAQSPQLEVGSYATSYIPTSGSAVTRVADVCNNGANEQVINSTEGVLYYEASYIDGSDYNSISISNSSGSEKSRTWYDDTNLIFASYVNNVNQTFISYPIFKNINYKIAIRYKLNDFALYVNGNKATNIVVNLGAVSPQNSYNKLNFNSGDIYNKFYGNVKDVRVYNTALTDSELQALTS